ncbi:hypothetical protein T492DRAFT_90296 [Pavlovales sp. CCMP2436]|nr:hypothetical protein T492DRAFT_90296 [Pavlovales sp. CCMP2436]
MLVTFSMSSTPEAHERHHTKYAPTVEKGSIQQQLYRHLARREAEANNIYFFVPPTTFPRPPQCGIAPLILFGIRPSWMVTKCSASRGEFQVKITYMVPIPYTAAHCVCTFTAAHCVRQPARILTRTKKKLFFLLSVRAAEHREKLIKWISESQQTSTFEIGYGCAVLSYWHCYRIRISVRVSVSVFVGVLSSYS